ncbi:MAG: LysR family transcriptional regulator, partial [Rhodanobacteraceae bacterium]
RPAELARHRTIAYSYWTAHDEWAFSGPEGAASVRIQPFMHANNGDTCRLAALAHQGVILQPDFLVGPDLQRGDLVEVMPDYRAVEIGIHAVYPSRKQLPVKTRKLVDFLVAAFKKPPWQQAA